MRKFLQYLSDFHREITPWRYGLALVFTALVVAFNYALDFEDQYIDRIPNWGLRSLALAGYHLLTYLGTLAFLLPKAAWKKLPNSVFFKCVLGFAILGGSRAIQVYSITSGSFHAATQIFWNKTLDNLHGFVTIAVALWLVHRFYDRGASHGLYGLRVRGVNFKPYLVLLGLMVPIIAIGTQFADITQYYPVYKRTYGFLFAAYYDIPESLAVLLFESAYLLDFINTELFFRGFLILGFVKWLGKDAVLPMAATYVSFHFGKPMPEAISSLFGGYILGVIALYSRNIWGGVFVHMGIAGLMELFAYLLVDGR